MRSIIEKLGWRVRYVPREVIGDYNACYRVLYKGREIYPPAAVRLGIPLGEIWILDELRGFEEYVLFHELREIIHRYNGMSAEEAHLMARVDEAVRYCGDPKWLEYFDRFPDCTVPRACLVRLCEMIAENHRDPHDLYRSLVRCANALGREC